LAACLAAARQFTPPVKRRERSVAHGLPWAFYVSREGAKTRRRHFYPQIPQINADFGGMSCRCAAIHTAGKKAQRLFSLTRRREGEFVGADLGVRPQNTVLVTV